MRIWIAALLISAAPLTTHAGEAWIGAFGHDVPIGIAECCFERGADLQLGLRSGPLSLFRAAGDWRLYAFGSANTAGGVPFAATGLAWRWPLGKSGLYVQPGLGAAVQFASDARRQARPDRLNLGSRVLFEPELSLGWRVDRRWGLEFSYVHLSHAQIAGRQNPGLDDLGIRAAYTFGG